MTVEGWGAKEIICIKWVSDRKKLGKGWDGEVNITIMIISFAFPHPRLNPNLLICINH